MTSQKNIVTTIFLTFAALFFVACAEDSSPTGGSNDDWHNRIENIPVKRSSSSSAQSSSSAYKLDDVFNPDISYGEITDKRDGKKYRTVQIEDQTWMAQNLNYADSVNTPSLKGKMWCGGDSTIQDYCDIFGRLYTWGAAVDSIEFVKEGYNISTNYGDYLHDTTPSPKIIRGICPEGWRLPSSDEFDDLFQKFGGFSTAGKALKAKTTLWNTDSGSDRAGFSAIPTGYLFHDGSMKYVGENANFHTTQYNNLHSVIKVLAANRANASSEFRLRKEGYSIRCIKITEDDLSADDPVADEDSTVDNDSTADELTK